MTKTIETMTAAGVDVLEMALFHRRLPTNADGTLTEESLVAIRNVIIGLHLVGLERDSFKGQLESYWR